MSLYTVEELAERCEVTVEFIGRLRKEGGQFHPAVTVTRIAEEPIELYDSLDALMLLWVKSLVEEGQNFPDARRGAEGIVEGYFEDAEAGLGLTRADILREELALLLKKSKTD